MTKRKVLQHFPLTTKIKTLVGGMFNFVRQTYEKKIVV